MASLVWTLAVTTSIAAAQTTQGLIAGRVTDSNTGQAVAAATLTYTNLAVGTTGSVQSGDSGYYVVPFASPGRYRVRVSADRYQAQEVHELELAVAARLDLDFRLRPLADVWESGQFRSLILPNSEAVLTFYGPDVDATRSILFDMPRGLRGGLESTVSAVIDPSQLRELPLPGRDVYTALVVLPGVTADAATSRGLGLSVNGQRPSASNFMLDGVENNDYLNSGPLTALAPEAVQEYRVSVSSFSAEYGRTSGYLANAVTRPGGASWHGTGYFHLKNEALNANGFRENLRGSPKSPLKQGQSGFEAGGPLSRRFFGSTAAEYLRSRGRGEIQDLQLPTTEFVGFTAASTTSRRLMETFPAPPVTRGRALVASVPFAPPVSFDRLLLLQRADYVPEHGRHRWLGRVAVSRVSRPDFIWTPYRDFVSAMHNNSVGLAMGGTLQSSAALAHEVRLGWSSGDLGWERAREDTPTLASFDGTILPGSPAFYAFLNRGRNLEVSHNVLWARERHILKFGGGALMRRLDGGLTAGTGGRYLFGDYLDFIVDRPLYYSVSLSRTALPSFAEPTLYREYAYTQFHFFAHDTWRVSPRLVLNFGLRYENFGSPENLRPQDDVRLELGTGNDLPERIRSAHLSFGGTGRLYTTDMRSFAPRFGFSYDAFGSGKTLLRGAYGLFYDRPFDNLWLNTRNNAFLLATFRALQADYLRSAATLRTRYRGEPFSSDFPMLTLIQPDLRNGYAQSLFAGVQRTLADLWNIEVNYLGSLGRRLITTDQVNRPDGSHNPHLPVFSYRGSQGKSTYHAMAAVVRYRTSRAQLQIAYTWGRSIDVQSEPLASDFFDLSFTRLTPSRTDRGIAAFTRQYDSSGDRANSDFDQRHNLVVLSIWRLPNALQSTPVAPLLRNWRTSQTGALRTGFPYTVYAGSTELLFNNRADVVEQYAADERVPGGKRVLSATAFREPSGVIGTSGRNAFRGPGMASLDASISREIAVRWLGDAGRLILRADAYNVLNHANLDTPDAFYHSSTFGTALYGRRGRDTGFPALVPFVETPRQIELMLRIHF